jgi:hypothetical protein
MIFSSRSIEIYYSLTFLTFNIAQYKLKKGLLYIPQINKGDDWLKSYLVCTFQEVLKHLIFFTCLFIMYSGITKIYYGKTVGQIFTKPVQIAGTTQKFFPSKLFFIVVDIYAARRCEYM